MAARVPIKGSLIFFDSKGDMKPKGVNVGMEMESRSHIEGATRAVALWRFDVVPDPIDPADDRRPAHPGLAAPEGRPR